MEENSQAHMETDVSSTTDDVPETQEVTGSHGDMEMVIVVEKVEDDSVKDVNHEQPQGSKIISATTNCETSPLKAVMPHNIVIKSPLKESNVSKTILMLPSNFESQSILNKNTPISSKTSPVKQQPESSVKVDFPGKSTENTIDGSSPIKVSQFQNIIHKSPFKDVKLVSNSPIKVIKVQETIQKKEVSVQERTPFKNDKPVEVNLQKTLHKQYENPLNKVTNLQENQNKQVILQENSPNKNMNTPENSSKEVKLQEKLFTKENLVETTSNAEVVETLDKAVNSEKTSSTEEKLQDSPTSKDATISKSFKPNEQVLPSQDIGITNNVTVKKLNVCAKTDITAHPAEVNSDQLNHSQNSSDFSEKEHNRSISRELKSLINSAKESKIISECTQLTSKTRKSRSQLDTSNTSLNISLEVDKVSHRRGSTNSQMSSCSEKSEKGWKRSMRSHNPEFVNKCKQFLNSVTSRVRNDSDDAMSEDETHTTSKDNVETGPDHSDSLPTSRKKKKFSDKSVLDEGMNKPRSDAFCWRCHWTVAQEGNDKAHSPLHCTVCPRTYHYKCLSINERKTTPEKNWVCPDCFLVLQAESSDTRSPAMKKTSLGMLCDLLKYALERMMDLNGVEPFIHPVDRTSFPDYDKYVVHPMDLTQMKKNIADGLYGSTEAFIADAQWILHNSIIFNTCEKAFLQSKLTIGARALVRSCRAEMGEIEACPECYASAHARKPTWFTDVCSTPHILLWAKLKGFPYWPAKGMTINSSGLVDVRFFGAHDRAWVPAKDCFLFCEKDPNNFRNKRQDILDAMREAEQHIRSISRKYGKFIYSPFKTQFDPSKLAEQLKMMIPSLQGEIKTLIKEKIRIASPLTAKEKRRSTSKGSKSSSINDCDGSESEDTSTSARTEAIRTDKDNNSEKVAMVDSPVVAKVDSLVVAKVPSPNPEEPIFTRKRRHSNLEEARCMTVIETSVAVKKKSKDSTEQKKPEEQEPSSSKEEKAQSILKTTEFTESTSKKKTDTPKSRSNYEEPSSSTLEEKESQEKKESLRVTPIKLIALPRQNKQTPKMFTTTKVPSKPGTPNEEEKSLQRTKPTRSEKSSTGERAKEDRKSQKRRNSKANKSFNSSSTPKSAKTSEKKTESNDFTCWKEVRPRESKKKEAKETADEANKSTSNNSLLKPIESPMLAKGQLRFDDDTILAVIARERGGSNSGLPTISNVCSLSTTAQASATTGTPTTSIAQSIDITVEASSSSSIFVPTSTESIHNVKDAVTKLQKLRDNNEPVVGRVGVRAFARMTSPSRNDNVEVEIKAEPIDLEESDESRHSEKMDLMNACKLQPVNQSQSLRDVRINRVVVGPSFSVNKGGNVVVRPRARKTFPPRREEGRSELNGKNSMVYIPIQPPATQPPVRALRPLLPAPRPAAPLSTVNNAVNTVITPLKPSTSTLTSPTNISAGQVTVPTVGPTIGQVPTTVHTVPLMTSVNGQWMFSLQPVMSVGGVDNPTASPMVNGISERGTTTPTLLPVQSTSTPINTASATPGQNTNTPVEMPRLQQRPTAVFPFDSGVNGPVPTPPNAGPVTAKLNQNAGKLADFFRMLLEDSLEKLDEPAAVAATLRMQLETALWRHAQELDELKHNHELTLAEMRHSFEKEKVRVLNDTKRMAQIELEAAVKAAKSKQWCVNCSQEAQFYCCWNTAYCDYPCQRAHWPQHFANCSQRTSKDGNECDINPESRLQPQPDVLPKSAAAQAPALTVGGKIAAPRSLVTHESPQKASIIVSMVEDTTGIQTMKCVGTYKPTQSQSQVPPLIINKQVMNEEANKKVVTSGGYLIVGSTGNTASVITPAPTRRPHTIQYFT